MKTSVMTGLLCLWLCSCGGNKKTTIMPEDLQLKAGDVVLRRGSGLTSRAVLMADKGGTYSHVGIVADSAGVMVVVHAVPGEPDYKGDPDRVKMEPATKFYARINAETGCVMRCADSTVAERAAEVAVRVYRRGTLFDHDYDESDTTRMYCCELVEFAYMMAGLPLATAPRHNFNGPGLQFDNIMLPSDFLKSPHLWQVVAF